MDVRRLPMARYLGVDPLPQPVIEIGTGVNDGVGVIGVGVIVDAHDADAELVLEGGVLRRAADALLATDVTWSSRGRPWRGSHATMTPTQLANQLLDQGFRTQHLRFMPGLGDLQWQQQHMLIVPPHNYFAAPAGESPFYRRRRERLGRARDECSGRRHLASRPMPRWSKGDTVTTPPPRPRSPGAAMPTATRAIPEGAGNGSSSSDDESCPRSRSRPPRHARRRVTTSQ